MSTLKAALHLTSIGVLALAALPALAATVKRHEQQQLPVRAPSGPPSRRPTATLAITSILFNGRSRHDRALQDQRDLHRRLSH